MKMRVNIFSCLLAFILGCNVTAEILHEIVQEKTSATLRCPHSVEGEVTWSRESHGNKVDILTVSGDTDLKHIPDRGKRYSSWADKSLVIHRVTISDSGRYLCNNEPAVELTVIPSGTIRVDATEGTTITLTCPHDVGGSHTTWSRGSGDIQQEKGFYVSSIDNTLRITRVQLRNSGLYYCDGKPAVDLNVIKAPTATTAPSMTTTKKKRQNWKHGEEGKKRGKMTPPPPPPPPTAKETTESTSTANTATPYLWQMWVRTVIGILYLIIMTSITVTTWRKARQIAATATENDL